MKIAMIGERDGFPNVGGVLTLSMIIRHRLEEQGADYAVLTHSTPAMRYSHYIAIGCSSVWAYFKIARSLLCNPTAEFHWIPCFHPPSYVRHKFKAIMARFVLRLVQKAGIMVWTLSLAEKRELDNGRCNITSIPFECLKAGPVSLERGSVDQTNVPPPQERVYDLIYLGRPVRQKGWYAFLRILKSLPCRAQAIVPYLPPSKMPACLELRVGLDDAQVSRHLANSKILIMPSDYESFGFAQAEALSQGCCVPVLGQWPLWTDVAELQWQGLAENDIVDRLRSLIGNTQYRKRLIDRQRSAWASRPERVFPSMII